ncbi:MAG: 16S rRNA (guanine(527)-N(7))-methyltransferase RsmG [Bacillota bacterium]|nr:16S rRNA (guanine(527)-N(7))-methyltransferase RsmG [Bacillota bacterium]
MIIEEAKKFGINLSLFEEEQFKKYAELLLQYNKVVNLTAITDLPEIEEKHFLDSVCTLSAKEFKENAKVIDVGSGAGFPGLPIKIARPDLEVILLDSLKKRVEFLEAVIKELNLKNIEAIHMRAEDAGSDLLYREKFDVAVSRAVADLSVLTEYCLPFVKVGGTFIALKGPKPEEEIDRAQKAISLLGGEFEEKIPIILPDGIAHSLIIIRKLRQAPANYPRKAGKPTKKPLD